MIDENLTTSEIRFERRGAIAIITLTRADRGNAFTAQMGQTLQAIWSEVKRNPDIRVAVITAEGDRHFCTGADLAKMSEGQEEQGLRNVPLEEAVTLTSLQNKVWKPVVCAVNGLVVGGGLHFVVDSDVIVAAATARFVDTHVNVGQVGAIENIGLAKRLPLGTALRMTLQGRGFQLSAERAYQLGMVDELVPTAADVLPKALEIAEDMAKNSPVAMARSKEALWHSMETGYHSALEYAWSLLRMQWAHPDSIEGPTAFVERREPEWNPDPSALR
ncbi:MAG TPA: enoyl-CoA hydratase/isomerase family protein [Novosphingobium sp.]